MVHAMTRAVNEKHGALPNVMVMIIGLEIDHHFFDVEDSSSHSVILRES